MNYGRPKPFLPDGSHESPPMTCPKCQAEFEPPGGAKRHATGDTVCPACGLRLLRSVTGVVRTSAVMISAGDEDAFYNSLQDVPEPLRNRLLESTNGDNAGTIVIADRAGKEQLTEVLARRENPRPESPGNAAVAAVNQAVQHLAQRRSWLPWVMFILVLVVAGIVSAWLGLRW